MSRRGDLYSKVQCIMDNGHWESPVDRQNDTHTQLKTLLSSNSVDGWEQCGFFVQLKERRELY